MPRECFFTDYSKNENNDEPIHYHLGEVKLNLKESVKITDFFKELKFDLGKSVSNQNVEEAANGLMKREYDGAIK